MVFKVDVGKSDFDADDDIAAEGLSVDAIYKMIYNMCKKFWGGKF